MCVCVFLTFAAALPEACRPMLDILERKSLHYYRKTHCQFFGEQSRLEACPGGSFDALIISGAFLGTGHMPIDALREAARLLKKGGGRGQRCQIYCRALDVPDQSNSLSKAASS